MAVAGACTAAIAVPGAAGSTAQAERQQIRPAGSVRPVPGKVTTAKSAPLTGVKKLTVRSLQSCNAVGAQDGAKHLAAGQCLKPGSYLVDHGANESYLLRYQADGNLVLIYMDRWSDYSGARWNTGTAGRQAGRAVMQSDGNFVLYDAGGNPYWTTGTAGCGSRGAWLRVQLDSNVVMYDRDSRALWAARNGPATPNCAKPDPGDAPGGYVVPHGHSRHIVNRNGSAADAWGGGNRNGTAVAASGAEGGNINQQWVFWQKSNGYYAIEKDPERGGQVLDVDKGSGTTAIWHMAGNDGSDNQQWKFVDAGDGWYTIRSRWLPDKCLTAAGIGQRLVVAGCFSSRDVYWKPV